MYAQVQAYEARSGMSVTRPSTFRCQEWYVCNKAKYIKKVSLSDWLGCLSACLFAMENSIQANIVVDIRRAMVC